MWVPEVLLELYQQYKDDWIVLLLFDDLLDWYYCIIYSHHCYYIDII